MARIYNELRNYQNIPRELVFDKSLSDRARFVYVFMACKPDDWDFYLEPMAKDIGYSVDTLRKYLNELVASGWLVKGEQTNKKGVFGAVEYTLKATKFTDTENFRYGKNTAQENIDNISLPNTKETINKEIKKEEKEIDKSISKSNKELFEECWLSYNRKGSKKKALEQWQKISDETKAHILTHIKAYVGSRDRQFQKDFERYLRDKTFNDVVYKGNSIIYDPMVGVGDDYMPATDGAIKWNETNKCYIYIGMFFGYIPDGYTDDNRPNGARIMLNNGGGLLEWDSETKKWNKK